MNVTKAMARAITEDAICGKEYKELQDLIIKAAENKQFSVVVPKLSILTQKRLLKDGFIIVRVYPDPSEELISNPSNTTEDFSHRISW